MMKTTKKPIGLMDLHVRLFATSPVTEEAKVLRWFADAVVRACAEPASEMRRRVFEAVEVLKEDL